MARGYLKVLLQKQDSNEIIFLALLFLMAFFIRVQPIFQNLISFHYDMSRDAFIAEQIWRNFNLKILGPPTSTPGLYHGVLYYYLLAPAYFLGHGDPRFASTWFSIINSLSVIPIYFLSKSLFKSKFWGVISALLFIVSFEAIGYGPWLSNPGPAVFTSACFFHFLFKWIKGKKEGFVLSVVFAAVSTQFQFFLIYLFFVIFFAWYFFKPRVTLRELFFSFILVLMLFSTFIISTIKFGSIGQILYGVLGILSSKGILSIRFTDLVFEYLNSFVDVFVNNFSPTNIFIGGLMALMVTIFAYIRREYFILLGLLSSLLIFMFGGHTNVYSSIGLITPAILGMTLFLREIAHFDSKAFLILLLLIVISNFNTVTTNFKKGQILLVIPKEMILDSQLKLIDKTYQLSQGRPFSINSLTLPLWTNTTWAYLYHYYALNKYGYLPKFYGRDQIGLLGDDVFEKTATPSEDSFFIIEPLNGIPENFIDSEKRLEDARTELIKEYNFQGIILEQRKPKLSSMSGELKSI